MTEEQRLVVCHALELLHQECAHVIERFTSAEQLHQFALNYIPNDGTTPLLAVVQHALCDAGTATFIYWGFEDLLFDPDLRASTASKASEWNCDAVLTAIESRFDFADFATNDIYFNPAEEYQWNVIQRKQLVASGVKPDRMIAIGKKPIDRQWLV